MKNTFTISPSPHIHDKVSTPRLMRDVVIALTPALLISFYFFGLNAVLVTAVSVATCVGFEWFLQKYALKVKPSIHDFSAVITGILLAMNLPSSLPLHIVVLGGIFAIGVVKVTFGGLGQNPFNPAIAGRIFLLISFPTEMTSWVAPTGVDAFSGATPLALIKEGLSNGIPVAEIMAKNNLTYAQMLFGQMGGSFGEVSSLALLLGFVYLLVRKVITWHIPITIFTTVAVFTGIFYMIDPAHYADPLFHLLSGGLILGAVFMATDYVTSPMTKKGMVIFAIGIGLLTCIIRMWGSFPEGISFAILIMNALVPLINTYVKPKRFGEVSNG